jgi:hypothetical protein
MELCRSSAVRRRGQSWLATVTLSERDDGHERGGLLFPLLFAHRPKTDGHGLPSRLGFEPLCFRVSSGSPAVSRGPRAPRISGCIGWTSSLDGPERV